MHPSLAALDIGSYDLPASSHMLRLALQLTASHAKNALIQNLEPLVEIVEAAAIVQKDNVHKSFAAAKGLITTGIDNP
jgi:hypothetical protein